MTGNETKLAGGVEAGAFGEIFLGEFAGFASFADVQPEFGEDRIMFRHDSWSTLNPGQKSVSLAGFQFVSRLCGFALKEKAGIFQSRLALCKSFTCRC